MTTRTIPLLVIFAFACGSPPKVSAQPLPLPAPSSSTAVAPPPKTQSTDALALVRDAVVHFQELLARGEDERFIDEVVVPEELEKVLDGRPKAELVANFRADKHAGVVRLLAQVATAKPKRIVEENGRTLVTFQGGEHAHDMTFVVDGKNVYIKN